MSTDTEPSARTRASNRARVALQLELAAALGSARVQKRGDAARAVAALLHFAAVGVEDTIEHAVVRIARRLEHQRLVEADAGVPIGEGAHAIGIDRCAGERGGGVEDEKIVSQPLHLHELDAHAASIADAITAARPARAAGTY